MLLVVSSVGGGDPTQPNQCPQPAFFLALSFMQAVGKKDCGCEGGRISEGRNKFPFSLPKKEEASGAYMVKVRNDENGLERCFAVFILAPL